MASTSTKARSVNEVLVYIKTELFDQFGIEPASVKPSATFDDLKLDTLEVFGIIQDVEIRYGVRVPDDVAPNLKSPSELARCARSLTPYLSNIPPPV